MVMVSVMVAVSCVVAFSVGRSNDAPGNVLHRCVRLDLDNRPHTTAPLLHLSLKNMPQVTIWRETPGLRWYIVGIGYDEVRQADKVGRVGSKLDW